MTKKKFIKLNNQIIRENYPPCIIIDLGINHSGSSENLEFLSRKDLLKYLVNNKLLH